MLSSDLCREISLGIKVKFLVARFFLACSCVYALDSFAIVNGVQAEPSQLKAVQAFILTADNRECSGTFLNHNTFLTARHCLRVGMEHANIKGIRPINYFYINEKGCNGPLARDELYLITNVLKNDVALVVFPDGTTDRLGIAPADLPKLEFSDLAPGSSIVMAGYGQYIIGDNSGRGILRVGYNGLDKVFPHIFITNGYYSPQGQPPGEIASLGTGDSGGPLINPVSKGVVGVLSTASEFEKTQSVFPIQDWHVRLKQPQIIEFLNWVASCPEGYGPCASADNLPLYTFGLIEWLSVFESFHRRPWTSADQPPVDISACQ